jgi:hypothetical protein
LAEWICRARNRLDPPRMSRPLDRPERGTSPRDVQMMAREEDLSLQTRARLKATPGIPRRKICESCYRSRPRYDSVSARRVPPIEFRNGQAGTLASKRAVAPQSRASVATHARTACAAAPRA